MERVKGIEPSWPAWKAGALPLSYTRKKNTNAGSSAQSKFWWTGQDLNLRTLARADLQSAAIDHSATCPHKLFN